MKKTLSIILVSTLVVSSIFAFAGCSQLDVAEQPDPVVIYAEKIYPSAIGNCLTDASVKVPAIDAYMKEYNANADDTAKINYDSIKYNKEAGYYYVNDNSTDVGIKFRLDQSMSIVSASIYTGTLDQTTRNVYNIVINAIETSGYKALMSAEDKAIIQHTLNGFNGVSSAKNDVQQIFNGQENFAAKWANNVAEFEIPVKPDELPKPDTSHSLAAVQMPTIEVPSITLDTTIVEGTRLDDGTEVKPQDVSNIANKITSASSQIASVNQYNKTTPEGVNSVLDDLVINATKRETGKLLTDASMQVGKLQGSTGTSTLEVTQKLTGELKTAFAEFEKQTKPAVQTSQGYGDVTIYAKSSDLVSQVFTKEQLTVNKNAKPSVTDAMTMLNEAIAAQEKVQKNVSGISTLQYIQTPNQSKPSIITLEYRDGSYNPGYRASDAAKVYTL